MEGRTRKINSEGRKEGMTEITQRSKECVMWNVEIINRAYQRVPECHRVHEVQDSQKATYS